MGNSITKAILRWLKCVVSLVYHSRLSVYQLEGESSTGHMRVTVADDGSVLLFVLKLVFNDQAEVKRTGSVWAFSVHKLAKADSDLVVVGAGRLLLRRFVREGFQVTPKWIRLATDITEDPDTLISRFPGPYKNSVARMVNKAKSKGFTCETTTDPKWTYPFYNQMYKPYSVNRHGKKTILYGYKDIGKDFRRGHLLLVKKNDVYVGGAILVSHGDALGFLHSGILNGSNDLLKEGVSNALYYFMLQDAYQSGYKRIDWGLSHSFLTDGVTMYKLKWGSVPVQEDIGTGAFAVIAPGMAEAGRRFLQANPFFQWCSGVILPPEK
ncbi:MAG: hypothetical protein ABFD64_09545 [Armatimonadota bacterium]